MKLLKFILVFFLVASSFVGCDGKDPIPEDDNTQNEQPDQPQDQPEEQPQNPPQGGGDTTKIPEVLNVEPILENWTEVSSDYGTLPASIKIYKSPAKSLDKLIIAYIAVAELSSATFDLWSISDPEIDGTSEPFRTPSQIYNTEKWPVVINGGFFYSSGGKYYTSSLAVRDSIVLAHNINYASEDWKKIYYPTRAALLGYGDGTYEAAWTYYNNNAATDYVYPQPADNKWGYTPKAVPSATYPEGAKKLSAKIGIGGGPLLVREGKFVNSYVAELFNGTSGIGPDIDAPRTAVGVTKDNKIIFFVCEGRNMTEGVKGLTTEDVANIMLALGCVEAINLDGGGSSCMLVNGKETIKVSDGSQRAVASTLMLK
ncbi:MAG: phosphodiester glycosidase family protein [Bacteroidales bacterium]|nr:phosphodiester glycosidase family protein [Bacteroidales bacterium]